MLLAPANEENERDTLLLLGQFGDGPNNTVHPVKVSVVGSLTLLAPDGAELDAAGVSYANPADTSDEKQRADGYGMARFDLSAQTVTFECFPRFATQGEDGRPTQFPGWPVTVPLEGRPQTR